MHILDIKIVKVTLGMILLLTSFMFNNVSAQTLCGNIIEMEDGEEFSTPIDDCDFPFGPVQTNSSLTLTFNGTILEDGGVYTLENQTGDITFSGFGVQPFSTFGTVYKQQGDDYLVVGPTYRETILSAPGVYVVYVTENELILSSTWYQKLQSFFLQTALAAFGDKTLITFEVVETPSEPDPIDPLILQYAPILYFHPDEDYFPMDVESFVDASALWATNGSSPDTQLSTADDLRFQEFENMIDFGIDTSDMYLTFSDPDASQSIDLAQARSTYESMKKDDPTIYYTKMTDTTNYGKEFTVLQYWYFYAMNNWGERVSGFFTNNHEGDWESTFVFLNEDEEPEYVAYSSHLNDQYPVNHPLQYDSVRRGWNSDEIEKNGDRVKNYVALGSHANYSDNGIDGNHKIPGQKDDITSNTGDILDSFSFNVTDGPWTQYTGLFGAFTDKSGFNGPQGPTHINVTGQTRFSQPIEWAGLNNYFKVVINTTTDTIEDTKQGIQMVFNPILDMGTEVTIQVHNEFITFGNNILALNPLPIFWDITSNLENDTFSTLLILQYDPEAVLAVGGSEEELVILYYNPETNTLEPLDSEVDIEANTVSATTTHFSRYLLGFEEIEEETTIEDEEGILDEESTLGVATTTAHRTQSSRTRIQRPEARVLGISTSVAKQQVQQLGKLVDKISVLFNSRGGISDSQREVLVGVLGNIVNLLESLN